MSKKYTSKDIRVLKEIEHIQLNPGMYIGDTTTPTHLSEEALDNALDEAMGGYAKIIAVVIDTKENRYSILDSGRGIPLENRIPVTISSKLFSGSKFQDKKSAYEISSGLHGIGLVAVNALSKEYSLEIYKDGKKGVFNFKDAVLKYSRITKHDGETPFSTKIEFIPDEKYFETVTPDLDRLRNRLTTASAEMPEGILFVLKVDDKQEIFDLSLQEHFVLSCLSAETRKKPIEINELSSYKKPEKFNALFTYEDNGSVTPKIISSVNLLPVASGGRHVAAFQDMLKDFFIAKAKKYDYRFQPNDCLYRLRAYLSLNLIKPKFSGQTKDVLINRKDDLEVFIKEFKTQLENIDEELVKSYLESFHEYRSKLDSKKLTKQTNGRRASTKFTKLRDCTTREGELYIVEGESAGGSLLQCRNPKIHAVLPLKGKSIPNATTKKDILKNNEVKELITAIGAGVDPHFDIDKMRYQKIICATDADHDGNHIACLVTMVIAILMPDIIKEGRYFIAQTPLFAINEGKTFIPLWNDKELDQARNENRKIQRYKGLGEMNPQQLQVCLTEEKTRNLTSIEYSDDINKLIKLFSSPEEKRKLVT
jgi:DNA gyrase/topoisomerase IV subunit B